MGSISRDLQPHTILQRRIDQRGQLVERVGAEHVDVEMFQPQPVQHAGHMVVAGQTQQQRDQQNQDRSFQREAQQAVREAQYQSRQAESDNRSVARQAEYQQQQRERTEQAEKRQVQHDAERRLANDKQQLRNTCMQRYGRPDC